MSARAFGLAGFLAACLVAKCAGACALPAPQGLTTARLFITCLHAARPERRACEANYVAYAGRVGK